MPIKKDGTGKRWVEMELLVPGTPEQVWHAMATGAGSSGWFVKTEIEPHIGGAIRLDFGHGAVSTGEVTEWQAPHRFSYVERDWDKDAPPVATEITVIARSGDRCVVRMVHSLFSSEDSWDDQLENFESGWPAFFAILRLYLLHFSGVPAASFMTMSKVNEGSLSVWSRLGELLGLTAANVGERRTSPASSGAEAWAGVVEQVHQDAEHRYVLLRLDAPSPGILAVGTYEKGATTHSAAGGRANVNMCRFFYGERAEELKQESEAAWSAWHGKTFPEEPKPDAES